jgi:hypothetical protein
VYSQSAPRERAMSDRSGGATPNHLAVLRGHRVRHRHPDLLGREHQVVLDLLVGEADLAQGVVADERGAVAAEAVVDEGARAGLQTRVIGQARLDAIESPARFRGTGRDRRRHAQRGEEEDAGESAHFVTLAGSGL